MFNSPSYLQLLVISKAVRVLHRKKKQTIEIIRNGIKHLRIFDEIDLAPADLDWEYLLDNKNLDMIIENTKARKGIGNINKVARFVLVFCLL